MEETLDHRLVSESPTSVRQRRCLHAAPVLVLAAVGFGFVVWTQLGGSAIPDGEHEAITNFAKAGNDGNAGGKGNKGKGGKGRVDNPPDQNQDPCSANEGECKEGTSIHHGKKCTPQCQIDNTVAWPPGPRTCASGKFDHTFTCETPDPIPFPGIKRGVGAANGASQLTHIGMYAWNKTIGWWYNWNTDVVQNGCWQYPAPLDFQYRTNYVGGMFRQYQVEAEELEGNDWGSSIYDRTQWILGWNEPYGDKDLQDRPKHISPTDAYASLVKYEKVAKKISRKTGKTVQLVSPAISPKDEGMDWAKDYFCLFGKTCDGNRGKPDKKAINKRLSYVAVHWYACTTHKLIEGLDLVYKTFGLPIWLTEFNCGSQRSAKAPESEENEKHMAPATEALQLKYMQAALPILEQHPHVVRYAWYADETKSAASKYASLAHDGEFTKLGKYYNNYTAEAITFDCDALKQAKLDALKQAKLDAQAKKAKKR